MFIIFFVSLFTFAEKISYQANQVKYNQKTKKIILIGNAKIKSKSSSLFANKIDIDEKAKISIATGNVKFQNKKKKLSYKGQYLKYNYKKELIWSKKRSSIKQEEENLLIEADAFYGELKKNKLYAYTNVKITSLPPKNPFEINGNEATYYLNHSILLLSNDCEIKRTNVYTTSKFIQCHFKKKEIWLSDDVKIYMLDNKTQKENSLIKAEKVNYTYSKEEVFHFYNHASISNYNDTSTIFANYIKHLPNKGYTIAKKNPVFKNTKENLVIKGTLLEKFEDEKLLYIKGDVKITTKDVTASALLALYNTESDEAILYGDAYLKKDRSKFISENITFNLKSKDIKMNNAIEGVFPQ